MVVIGPTGSLGPVLYDTGTVGRPISKMNDVLAGSTVPLKVICRSSRIPASLESALSPV